MPLNYAQLKTELDTDPLALGYASLLAVGNHGAVADALNQSRAAVSIPRTTVPAWEVFDAIVPAEWASLTAQEKQRIQTILSMGTVRCSARTRAMRSWRPSGPGRPPEPIWRRCNPGRARARNSSSVNR